MKKYLQLLIAVVFTSTLSTTCNASPLKDQTLEQRKEIYKIASDYVKANSVPGLQFSLTPTKKINSWIVFKIIPKNVETDIAQLFLQKKNGKWITYAFGTSFPELEESNPELFK